MAGDVWRVEVGQRDIIEHNLLVVILRSLMKDIFELKTKNSSPTEVTEKRIQASLLFVTLKKLNRLEKLRYCWLSSRFSISVVCF